MFLAAAAAAAAAAAVVVVVCCKCLQTSARCPGRRQLQRMQHVIRDNELQQVPCDR
jgi:hypothetical protein